VMCYNVLSLVKGQRLLTHVHLIVQVSKISSAVAVKPQDA